MDTILVHLPAYRDPELGPTIKDALAQAKYPERIHFGICHQFNPDDAFSKDLDEFREDERFNIIDLHYTKAKGLPWARAQINDILLTDQDYVLQLDSHHRFIKDWDEILIDMFIDLENKGHKPVIGGYLPEYTLKGDRTMVVWQSQFRCFYPAYHTIFIGPGLLEGWEEMTEPVRARFLSGHFCFSRAQWARDVRHDPDIYFAGEEINITVRSFTKGYDLFGLHRLVIWHNTMRENRSEICKWDDDNKRGVDWTTIENKGRRKIKIMFGVEDNPGIDFGEYGLGTERTVEDYERYAGLDFKRRSVQPYTVENKVPPNPVYLNDGLYKESFVKSFYYVVTVEKKHFPGDYLAILVAFDDEDGKGMHTKFLNPNDFDKWGRIHYAEYFTCTKWPSRVVYWGQKKDGSFGSDRIEYKIEGYDDDE